RAGRRRRLRHRGAARPAPGVRSGRLRPDGVTADHDPGRRCRSGVGRVSAARAAARERVWNTAGAPTQDGRVVIDMDASLVTAHSDKEDATRTWKRTFGSTRYWRSP